MKFTKSVIIQKLATILLITFTFSICILRSKYALDVPYHSGDALAQMVGRMIGAFAITWLIMNFISLMKYMNFVSGTNFIFVIFIIVQLLTLGSEVNERKNISKVLDPIINLRDENKNSVFPKKVISEISDCLNVIVSISQDLTNDYQNEITELKVEQNKLEGEIGILFEPANLMTDEGLIQLKSNLTLFSTNLARHKSINDDYQIKLKERLESYDIRVPRFWRNFEIGRDKKEKLMEEFYNVEFEIIKNLRQIVETIEANKNSIRVEDGEFVFASQEVKNELNKLWELADILEKKEQESIRSIQIHEDNITNQMKALSNPNKKHD